MSLCSGLCKGWMKLASDRESTRVAQVVRAPRSKRSSWVRFLFPSRFFHRNPWIQIRVEILLKAFRLLLKKKNLYTAKVTHLCLLVYWSPVYTFKNLTPEKENILWDFSHIASFTKKWTFSRKIISYVVQRGRLLVTSVCTVWTLFIFSDVCH